MIVAEPPPAYAPTPPNVVVQETVVVRDRPRPVVKETVVVRDRPVVKEKVVVVDRPRHHSPRPREATQ